MKTNHRLFLFVAILILSVLACQMPSPVGQVTAVPVPGATPGSAILFQDDFSNPDKANWARDRATDGVTDYEGSQYHIWVNAANMYYWSTPGLSFADASIEVDATKRGGSEEGCFGLLCRHQDDRNFYFAIITHDGHYAILKVVDGAESLVGMDDFQLNDTAIKTGVVSDNHLRLDCVGDTLTFYVNGVRLAQVHDSALTTGDVGLLAGTFDTPGVSVFFDNLVVSRP